MRSCSRANDGRMTLPPSSFHWLKVAHHWLWEPCFIDEMASSRGLIPRYCFLLATFTGAPALRSSAHGLRQGGRFPDCRASMIWLVMDSRIADCVGMCRAPDCVFAKKGSSRYLVAVRRHPRQRLLRAKGPIICLAQAIGLGVKAIILPRGPTARPFATLSMAERLRRLFCESFNEGQSG
jgi:hypothetical protein